MYDSMFCMNLLKYKQFTIFSITTYYCYHMLNNEENKQKILNRFTWLVYNFMNLVSHFSKKKLSVN